MNPTRTASRPRPAVIRPVRGLILLLAWLCATGTHWDLVQIAAWSRMWFRAVQTESVTAALESTFAPKAACRLCAAVDEGRAAGDLASDALLRHLGRPVLLAWKEEALAGMTGEPDVYESVWSIHRRGMWRAEPPAPPPRRNHV